MSIYSYIISLLLFLSFCVRIECVYKTANPSYNFTIVHDPPYVDVGINDGYIKPKNEWTGYIIDMIKMISVKANFEYELYTPSGQGFHCNGNGDLYGNDYAGQYKCGQEDVLNTTIYYSKRFPIVSQAYWGMYYITPFRQALNTTFTVPFIDNMGLSMLQVKEETPVWSQVSLIFTPFGLDMWIVTFFLCGFVAMIVWLHEILETPSRKVDKVLLQMKNQVNRIDDEKVEQLMLTREEKFDGFYSMSALMKYPSYLAGTFGGLMTSSDDSETNTSERVAPTGNFAAIWSFFALMWISAYTARLAATLTINSASQSITSIDHLAAVKGTACATANTAYVDTLASTYPSLNLKTYSGGAESVQALVNGECDAVIDSVAAISAIANGATDLDMTSGQKYCTNDAHLVMVGQPLATGFTSMGVGVSYDNPELAQVLSYWINELRTCNPMSPTSECYQGNTGAGLNLETLRSQHVDIARCGNANGDEGVFSSSLSIMNFLVPILLVAVAGIIQASIYYINYIERFVEYRHCPDLIDLIDEDHHFANPNIHFYHRYSINNNDKKNGNGETTYLTVGSSVTNVKILRLPQENMSVSPKPFNLQNPSWNDTFETSVQGNILTVTRTDCNDGWGQDLILTGTCQETSDEDVELNSINTMNSCTANTTMDTSTNIDDLEQGEIREKDEDRVSANTNNSEEDTDDDEEFKEVKDVFVFINEDCRVLLLDAFFEVLDADEMLRIKVIRSALKYFLQTDMQSFFLLARFANILHPKFKTSYMFTSRRYSYKRLTTSIDALETEHDLKFKHTNMQRASEIKLEISSAIKVLLTRAIKESFHDNETGVFTFVLRDEIQVEEMKNQNEFGKKKRVESLSSKVKKDVGHEGTYIRSI